LCIGCFSAKSVEEFKFMGRWRDSEAYKNRQEAEHRLRERSEALKRIDDRFNQGANQRPDPTNWTPEKLALRRAGLALGFVFLGREEEFSAFESNVDSERCFKGSENAPHFNVLMGIADTLVSGSPERQALEHGLAALKFTGSRYNDEFSKYVFKYTPAWLRTEDAKMFFEAYHRKFPNVRMPKI